MRSLRPSRLRTLFTAALCAFPAVASAGEGMVTLKGGEGPGKGKKVVLISGDEEYRSEEALPMLAGILSKRHGFDTTVLFSVNDQGEIDPNNQASVTHPEQIDDADAIVILTRFRKWPDESMAHFAKAFEAGKPIVALRTSTHAFQFPGESKYKDYNGFGKNVLGENWVSHWGVHKKEGTRGILEPGQEMNPVLRGVSDIFGDTDVYEAYPPADATILLRGEVTQTLEADSAAAAYAKKRASDGAEQDVNTPMMPVAWTRTHKQEGGVENRIFTTTMGSASDLKSEGLRRLIVNGVFWGLGLEVPEKADVTPIVEFTPTDYGFNGAIPKVKPADIQAALDKAE